MTAEQTMTKLGFVKDETNTKLNEIFKDNFKFKEIHIDVYSANPCVSSSMPYMLLLRAVEKKILIKNSGNRLILKKNIDGYDTYFMNILLSEITKCYFKDTKGYIEFIINIQNIYYKMTIFN